MSNRRFSSHVFSGSFVLAFVLVTAALSQVQSGNIVGTIIDPAGSVIPGAKVTLQNTATGFQRTIDTNDSGHYVADSIPIGPYTITVSQAGFQSWSGRALNSAPRTA